MNRQGDRRSNEFGHMRFFTPELVMQLNSSDDEKVEKAMEQWEKASAAYRDHLRELQPKMPPQSRAVTTLSLHDWKVVKIAPEDAARETRATALIALKHNENLLLVVYLLSEKLRRIDPPAGWPSSADRVHWLYDELDADRSGQASFVHRILFSDGTTLVVPFSSCFLAQLAANRQMSHSDLMQMA